MRSSSLLTALLAGSVLCLQAQAATVTLVPSASSIVEGGSFTVDLALDASDAPGDHPGTYQGQVLIDFDPALLSYGGFTALDAVLLTPESTGTDNGRQTVTIDFGGATDTSTPGRFAFTALAGTAGSLADIGLRDADEFFGTFIANLPTNQPFAPEFSGTSVSVTAIPLPASVWLLGTAVGALGLRLRQRQHG